MPRACGRGRARGTAVCRKSHNFGFTPLRAVTVLLLVVSSTPLSTGRQSSALGAANQAEDLHTRRDLVETDPQAHCDLCADNWFFVLGAGGRTGSTTALTMFSSIPGFELSGEHWGLLRQEYDLMRNMDKSLSQGDTPAWKHRPMDRHALLCSIQELMKRIVFGVDYWGWLAKKTKVLGFKEVRYSSLAMTHFLHEVFPCARYVITYREEPATKVHADAFGAGYGKTWEHAATLFHRLAHQFNDTYSMLPVENLTTTMYNDILHDKLGVKNCSFSHILHDNAHGGYNKDSSVKTLFESDCDLSEVDFRLSPDERKKREMLWRSVRQEQEAEQQKHKRKHRI